MPRLIQQAAGVLRRVNPAARRERLAFKALRTQFYRDLWRQASANIGAECTDLIDGYMRIRHPDGHTFVRGPYVLVDSHLMYRMAGNKPLCHSLLKDVPGYEYVAYRTYTLDSLETAYAFLGELNKPVVVKPGADTGGGSGVRTHITSEAELLRASREAAGFAKMLMVEEQLSWENYRLLFLGDTLLHGVWRGPPTVTGDGRQTIADLVLAENEVRMAASGLSGTRALSPLKIDGEARATLASQGLSQRARPAAGRHVRVKTAVNQNNRFQQADVTAKVHPGYINLARRIRDVLPIKLMGMDVMASDISNEPSKGNFVINEINTTPGLHHHDLVDSQEPSGVPEALLRHLISTKAH